MAKGGRFAALGQPEALAQETRAFFKPCVEIPIDSKMEPGLAFHCRRGRNR
jgi:hypothetical protein